MADSYVKTNDFSDLFKGSDILMAVGVVGILLVMMIPLRPFILDILLSFNITLSLTILLVSMYILKPLDFSVFPSILLVATLFRLSLNVASTRLILLHGNEGLGAAGHVIKAFGHFVVGGNFVVGFIVFLVLVLINFIVITKGATRIAEVAARFTLDAMPGKQMSIDADLNAGLITDADARIRRTEVEQEANFYGAMDGASKFVRGDAVAGIVITLINILGGLIVGVLQQGMQVLDAAHTYTLLTVGDGLVTQIPALIVSTASGMLVTRSTASSDLSKEVGKQLFSQPKVIATTSVMLFIFALIPGMPKLSFLTISFVMAIFAYSVFKSSREIEETKAEVVPKDPTSESVEALLPLDLLGLDVGYSLIPFVDAGQGGEILERIRGLRRQLVLEMGFVVAAIHIRDDLQLKPSEYIIKLKGIDVAKGEIMLGHYLAITTGDEHIKLNGIETKEPAFGLPAVWIDEKEKESVQAKGFVVVDPATVISTHLAEVIKTHAHELLDRQNVQALLENFAINHPKLVQELVPDIIPLGTLQKVLQNLLRERISIRDLLTILETLADYVPITKDVDMLVGRVRQALSRAITKQYEDEAGNITVIMVSPDIEDSIVKSVQHTEYESFVTVDPDIIQNIVSGFQKFAKIFTDKGREPIILCSPNTRIYLRKILEKFFPNITVLSYNEVAHDTNIKSLGMLVLKDAD
ncbi:MAG: flagellar biosynthesis protein FlhA [Deltaproteobacteria bacterium]|nr:flagellar biosynthesis protein FlhA [Deltaproteobacteria bacterium]MBW1718207.1 flagellar biosynthesis protein FlhA [Deltaproteobacteria bacterium]MBW1938159.1 flagellar biosynthesis protein FlhA [Deltaproteobacteria bacterium]